MNIYVGNLSYGVQEGSLQELFSQYGKVTTVKIINDAQSGKSKGFGFVEMESESAAKQAIETLNGTDLDGRKLIVNEARPRADNGGGGGGGRGPRW